MSNQKKERKEKMGEKMFCLKCDFETTNLEEAWKHEDENYGHKITSDLEQRLSGGEHEKIMFYSGRW